MRIFEIDDNDKLVIILKNINIDISNEYETIKKIEKDLELTKSKHLRQVFASPFDAIENKLNTIIKHPFNNDKSTRDLKSKCKKYLLEIKNIKKRFDL